MKRAGEYSTSFTIPNITASVALDTITEDRTVTFPDLAMVDTSVIIYVFNSNSSAFVWNVIGNVRESETGDVIESISRGLHVFIWTGSYWARQKTGGGSTPATDTNTVIYPITMVNRAIGIDPDGLPVDTCFVAVHNDSLFNVCYFYTGVRDSTFVSMIGGSVTAANGLRMDGDTVKLANEIAGTTLTENVELEGHTNLVNIRLLAQELTFDPKVKTLFQANTNDSAIVEMKQMYKTHLDSVGDMDATLGKSYAGATLGQITANRTIDLQSLALDKRGVSFRILNLNNSAFTWNVSQASSTIVDEDGSLVTEIADRITDFVWDGVKWVKKSGGGGGGDTANLVFDTLGAGISSMLARNDTLFTKAFKNAYALTWTTDTDSSMKGTVDTTLMATRAWVSGNFGAGGGSGWSLTGNSISGADSVLGTTSNHGVKLMANGSLAGTMTRDGKLLWGNSTIKRYSAEFNDTVAYWKPVFIDNLGTGTLPPFVASLTVRGENALSTSYGLYVVDNANVSNLRIANNGDMTGRFGSLSSTLFQLGNATATIRAGNLATTTGTLLSLTHSTASTHTSGNLSIVATTGNATMSSGPGTMTSFEVKPIWAQTGTAIGKLWGIKINPSITSTLGEPVWFEMTSNASNWPSFYTQQARVTTTDATPTTLFTYTTSGVVTVTNSMTYVIECDIIGNRTGGASGASGDVGVYKYRGIFKRINGVVTLMSETLVNTNEDQAGWNVTSSISGTSILIQVTGAASNNISWHLTKGEVHRAGE